MTDYLDSLRVADVKDDSFYWTAKRKRLVLAFVANEGDTAKAAKEAGYVDEKHVETLLQHPAMVEAIREEAGVYLDVAGENEFTILQRLVNIARGNIYDYFDPNSPGTPSLRPFDELTPAQKLRVKRLQIKPTKFGTEEVIELHDPVAANDKLAKYLGLDKDGDQLAPEEFAARVMAAMEAMKQADALDRPAVDDAPGTV